MHSAARLALVPPIAKQCACGRWYRDWRRKTCRQCRIRPQLCPIAGCGRPHLSDRRVCSSCRRARLHIGKPYLDDSRARQAHRRLNARQDRLERNRLLHRDEDPYDGPGSPRARAQRLAVQRERGVRICANAACQRAHGDRTAALCRQCRLVWHESCADCSKPFKGEPSATVCATCRSRAKRARRRARAELSYFDATGDLDSTSSDVV